MFPDLFRDDVFTLESQRLFLRWPKASDAAQIVALAGDRGVAEMTSHIPHPYPPESATQIILAHRAANAEGKRLGLAITERRDPGKLIGMIGLQAANADGVRELGYWLGRPFWGQGYATEAAQALIDAAFLYGDVAAIRASVRVVNPASRNVLEKCGFRYEGGDMCARPAWGDCVPSDTYRLARALWLSLKGWRTPLPNERREQVAAVS